MAKFEELSLAVEMGYKSCEKGMNLQATLARLQELFVASKKEEESKTPFWQSDLFTDDEKNNLVQQVMEEIRDDLKDRAQAWLDDEEDVDIVMRLDPELDVTAELLQQIVVGNCCIEDYLSGEHEEHERSAKFMQRMELVDSDGQLTKRGYDYLETWGKQ